MKLKSLSTLIAIFILPLASVADVKKEEGIPLSNYNNLKELTFSPTHSEKNYLFGSVSIAPGVGYSHRTRIGKSGTSWDFKLGLTSVPLIDVAQTIPIPSMEYNVTKYARDTNETTSAYFSFGGGMAMIVPYIPLRGGVEFQNGFIDIGAKLLFGFFPSPEIRGGFNVSF